MAAGKWEVNGGMWVEADCNVTSGESLVRQFLFGNRFFEKEFGVKSNTLWLPDVFGYSWALPQIIKKSGLDYFMTIKISWSQFNKFPYDTFRWRGIDGTEVLTHYITTKNRPEDWAYTYNGFTDAEVVKCWTTTARRISTTCCLCLRLGRWRRRRNPGYAGECPGDEVPELHAGVQPGKAGFFEELDAAVSDDPSCRSGMGSFT